MKILIVSRSFYPENTPRSFRTTELVKEFARQGHDVTLITSKMNEYHVPFEKEHGVTIEDWGTLTFSDIDTSSKNPAVKIGKRAVRRALNLFLEYPDIQLMPKVKRALKNKKGFDLLISIAVPHPIHWGVAKAWNADGEIAKTWVADCGDPFMGATMDTFKKMFYFKYFEKMFCRKADYITVPIEEAKSGYYSEFRDKIRIIPQGFNFGEVEIDHDAYSPNEVPTFAYAGGLIPGGRDPGVFLEYLVSLDIDYKFILYTRTTALVEPFIERAKGRIEIRDYIPREELLKTLSKVDFLINFENDSTRALPSKLIDYYLIGRPVLNVPSRNIDTEKINLFLQGDYSGQFNYTGVDSYRIENVCGQFLELAESRETNADSYKK